MAYREIWEIEVRHEKLNKYRHIRGSDRNIVEQKADVQRLAWDEMWEKKKERETALRSKEEKKELAITRTNEAQEAINQLETILLHTLKVDDTIDWNSLLYKKKYPEKWPVKKEYPKQKPVEPKIVHVPSEPNRSGVKYQPDIGLFDKLFSKSRRRKEDEAERKFGSDHEIWEKKKRQTQQKNKKLKADYAENVKNWEIEKLKYEEQQEEAIKNWKIKKCRYEEKQEKSNKKILEKKSQYLNIEPDAIFDYCEMVLANSEYPDYFPQEWDLDYQPEARILIVDYSLPDIDRLPTVKTVKYVISRDEFTETNLSSTALSKESRPSGPGFAFAP